MTPKANAKTPTHPLGIPFGGMRLGSVAGVEFFLDWSLLLIFGLIALSLAVGALPQWHPDWSLWARWDFSLLAAALFFASIALHELSHALVGRALGIPIRRVTMFLFGGMAHMEREPQSPGVEFLTALIGPVVSIGLGLEATVAGLLLAGPSLINNLADPVSVIHGLGPVTTLLLWLGPINLLLGLFNLVPGFPLDGGRVFRSGLWWMTGDLHVATRVASALGQAVAFVLMGTGVLMAFGVAIPVLGTGLWSGLWLVLIGWFLNGSARQSYQQLLLRETLDHVKVADIMRSSARMVDGEMPIDALVREVLLRSQQQHFPVTAEDGRVVGIVGRDNVLAVPRERWGDLKVRDVMSSAEQVATVDPAEDVVRALREMRALEQAEVPVVDHGQFVGFLAVDDVLRFVSMYASAQPHRVA